MYNYIDKEDLIKLKNTAIEKGDIKLLNDVSRAINEKEDFEKKKMCDNVCDACGDIAKDMIAPKFIAVDQSSIVCDGDGNTEEDKIWGCDVAFDGAEDYTISVPRCILRLLLWQTVLNGRMSGIQSFLRREMVLQKI